MIDSFHNQIQHLANFYRDGFFLKQLYHLAAPIALQNLLTASLTMLGSIKVGQLGDASIAAVGLANQIFSCSA